MYDLDGSFAFHRQLDLEVTQRDRGLFAGLDTRTQTLDDQFALRRAFPHPAACRRRPRQEPGSPSPAPRVPLPACARAARRTGRRSPLPGTPTTCTSSSAAAASALSRRPWAVRLFLLARLVLLRARLRRVERRPQNPQRQPLHRGVQVQTAGRGAGLVGNPQPFSPASRSSTNCRPARTAPSSPPASVAASDTGAVAECSPPSPPRLVDETVVGLDQGSIPLRGTRERRRFRLVPGASHQARAQTRIPQQRAAELLFRPALPAPTSSGASGRRGSGMRSRQSASSSYMYTAFGVSVASWPCRPWSAVSPAQLAARKLVPACRFSKVSSRR